MKPVLYLELEREGRSGMLAHAGKGLTGWCFTGFALLPCFDLRTHDTLPGTVRIAMPPEMFHVHPQQ